MTTISGAGAHASAAATDRLPASKDGNKGYLSVDAIARIYGPRETVTALRAISAAALIADGAQVVVLGNQSAGDCRPFIVQWDADSSATHDGVNVFRPTTGAASTGDGRWVRVGPLVMFDIRDFGARCNGTDGSAGTDDTTAVQAAIDAAAAYKASTGRIGMVYVPVGITDVGELTLKSVVLFNEVPQKNHAVLRLRAGKNSNFITGDNAATLGGGSTAGGLSDYGFINITLDGNYANNTGDGWGFFAYGKRPLIDNLWIKNVRGIGFKNQWGLHDSLTDFAAEGFCRNVYISFCGMEGFIWRGPHDSVLQNIFVLSNGQKTDKTYKAMQIAGHGNCRIIGAHVHRWDPDTFTLKWPSVALSIETDGVEVSDSHLEGGWDSAVVIDANNCIIGPTNKCYAAGASGAKTVHIIGDNNQVLCNINGPAPYDVTPTPLYNDVKGVVIGDTGTTVKRNIIKGVITGCKAGSIDFTNSAGQNVVQVRGEQDGGTFIVGAAHDDDDVDLIIDRGSGTIERYFKPALGERIYRGPIRRSWLGGITAAGSSQSDAQVLDGSYDRYNVSTVAAGTGVLFEAALIGHEKWIANRGANPLLVYPHSGEIVEGLATNAPYRIPPGTVVAFHCKADGVWEASLNSTLQRLSRSGETVTASTPLLDLAQVWNSGGVAFTALTLDVTDTASATGSFLLDLKVGGSTKVRVRKDGFLNVAAAGALGFLARGYLQAPSDGVWTLTNNNGNDFDRLQFGGTDSARPALKRSSAALETKLADDSAYAQHNVSIAGLVDGVTAPSATSGLAKLFVDVADGDLKVIFGDGTVKTLTVDT